MNNAALIANRSQDGNYTDLTILVETKLINIMKAPGYFNIRVNNAMQRVFRGLGKDFPTLEAMLENYKDARIKTAIQAAQIEFTK